MTRKTRKDDMTNSSTASKVQLHWISEDISRVVPLKKKVKHGLPLYVLEVSFMRAYQKFRKSNPSIKICYVTFIKLKPTNVRHLKALERSVCCCNKCENVQLKLKSSSLQVYTAI